MYCTQQNLIDRFGQTEIIQLTDRAIPPAGTINTTVLEQAISDADAEINSYLTGYTLPLVTVPANLVRIACDISRYYLYEDRVIEQVQTRYDAAIKYLTQVAKGVIKLGPDTDGTVAVVSSDSAQFSSSPSVFGRDAG